MDEKEKETKFEIDYDKLADLVAQKLKTTQTAPNGDENKPVDTTAELLKVMTSQLEESKKVNGALLKMMEAQSGGKQVEECTDDDILSFSRYGGGK